MPDLVHGRTRRRSLAACEANAPLDRRIQKLPGPASTVLTYDGSSIKRLPAPEAPGNTEAERMDSAVRKFLSVPKEAYLREEARLKKARERKKRRK